MQPIILNEMGETLHGFSSRSEESPLSENDVHGMCKGVCVTRSISQTHKCIHCPKCGLRVVIPVSVQTYAQLRQWCADQIEARRRHACDVGALVVANTRLGG